LSRQGPDLTDPEKFKNYFDTRIDTIMPIQTQGDWGSCHLQASMAVVNETIGGAAIDTAYLLGAHQYELTLETLKGEYASALSESNPKKFNKKLEDMFKDGGTIFDDLRLLAGWTGKRVDSGSVPLFHTVEGEQNITHALVKKQFTTELSKVMNDIRVQRPPLTQAMEQVNSVYQKFFGPPMIDRLASSSVYRSAQVKIIERLEDGQVKPSTDFRYEAGSVNKLKVQFDGNKKVVQGFKSVGIGIEFAVQRLPEEEISDFLIQKIGVEKTPLLLAMEFSKKMKDATAIGTFEWLNTSKIKPIGWHAMYVRGLKTEVVNGKKVVTGLEVANSYGTEKGVGGAFYIPIEKMKDLKFSLYDVLINY